MTNSKHDEEQSVSTVQKMQFSNDAGNPEALPAMLAPNARMASVPAFSLNLKVARSNSKADNLAATCVTKTDSADKSPATGGLEVDRSDRKRTAQQAKLDRTMS